MDTAAGTGHVTPINRQVRGPTAPRGAGPRRSGDAPAWPVGGPTAVTSSEGARAGIARAPDDALGCARPRAWSVACTANGPRWGDGQALPPRAVTYQDGLPSETEKGERRTPTCRVITPARRLRPGRSAASRLRPRAARACDGAGAERSEPRSRLCRRLRAAGSQRRERPTPVSCSGVWTSVNDVRTFLLMSLL